MIINGANTDLPISLLLVEDNDGDARLFHKMLDSDGFRVHHRKRLAEALETMKHDKFDVILLDLGLPDSQGLDTLRRAASHEPEAPVIVVLTGNGDEWVAVDAVREGAQDYLVKGELDRNVLSRAIRYALERHNLQKALQQARQEAEVARQRDFYTALTDVPDLATEHVEPTAEVLDQLQSDYAQIAGDFLKFCQREKARPRAAVREFALHAAGMRMKARHIVQCHLDVLDILEKDASHSSVVTMTSDMRLLLVEVLGNMMDIYLSVYRVMQPSEREQ